MKQIMLLVVGATIFFMSCGEVATAVGTECVENSQTLFIEGSLSDEALILVESMEREGYNNFSFDEEFDDVLIVTGHRDGCSYTTTLKGIEQ